MNPDDLLGIEVEHNLLGKGVITRVDDDIFQIQFSKSYRFPDALINGPIKVVDPELRTLIMDSLDAMVEQERVNSQPQIKDNQPHQKQSVIPHAINNVVHEGFSYSDWVRLYPRHVVVMKGGMMYRAHYESAEIISRILNYVVFIDRFHRPSVGGPSEEKIAEALDRYNVSYIIVEDDRVVDGIDAEDPFVKFGISVKRYW